MRVTPLEIRQKSFEKVFRGYDKDEVVAFLTSLSNEWERMLDENKEFKIKLDQAEKEVQKLREVESSLYKTLKTAEDTGANMVQQANKTAELHLKEAHMRSEGLLNEAKNKAKGLMEKAESEARMLMDEMESALQQSYNDYRALEHKKKDLIKDLKRLAGEVVNKADTFEEDARFNLDDFVKSSKAVAREYGDFKAENDIELEMPKPIQVPEIKNSIVVDFDEKTTSEEENTERAKNTVKEVQPQVKAETVNGKAESASLSFFDELED